METKRKKGTGTIVENNGKYRAELQYVNPYTQKNTKLRGTLRSRKKDAEIDLRELQEKRDHILEASSPNVDSITVAAYYRNIFLRSEVCQKAAFRMQRSLRINIMYIVGYYGHLRM